RGCGASLSRRDHRPDARRRRGRAVRVPVEARKGCRLGQRLSDLLARLVEAQPLTYRRDDPLEAAEDERVPPLRLEAAARPGKAAVDVAERRQRRVRIQPTEGGLERIVVEN